ncbi:Rho termination factor N-terminal domain-containing protein [Halopseudomonas nanhaiensis]|uniref:Rho termination factor N-terminal domain-containing protein n=1 Tax=Halopseudomonas nanhaiensis TaxID=2830842 RepID=UPI001CBB8E97|nr:Rho termination factor N-terminal domain-containing protein [Halopseudomonas nanhaiensis]UAW97761.1 Rho termination factor N-terminal domain-containing protein [Halopseudomonas nanhaiensis]
MPRGSKEKYTDKQQRKAEHIEESYEEKGVPAREAEARAWATVNKQSGGGNRTGGSGQKKSESAKHRDASQSAHRAVKTRRGEPRSDRSLESETKDELMRKARAKDIRGRSSMRKQELVDALKKAS